MIFLKRIVKIIRKIVKIWHCYGSVWQDLLIMPLQAAIGIANLIAMAMEKREGVPRAEALKRIWLRDSKGLIVKDRPEGGISHHKADFAHEHR